MKKKKPLVVISFIILFLFSFAGAILTSYIAHENMHKVDFRSINKTFEEICYLDETFGGYYLLDYSTEQKEEFYAISKHAELRAYGVQGAILLVYFVAVGMIILQKK